VRSWARSPTWRPEQLHGKTVDHRTDVYGLGLILNEMVLGTRPLSAADVIARIKRAPVSARSIDPRVPGELDAVITRCLQPSPDRRFKTALELAAALTSLQRTGRLPAPALPKPQPWMRRAALVVLLLALVWGAFAGASKFGPRLSRGAGSLFATTLKAVPEMVKTSGTEAVLVPRRRHGR
jgi:hypothetical protein